MIEDYINLVTEDSFIKELNENELDLLLNFDDKKTE